MKTGYSAAVARLFWIENKQVAKILYMEYVETNCASCNRNIKKRKSDFHLYSKHYCNVKCSNSGKVTGKWLKCAKCKKEIYRSNASIRRSKSGKLYCSRSCATSINNKLIKSGCNSVKYAHGGSSYRKKAIQKYGRVCQNIDCSMKKVFAESVSEWPIELLEVHHIDGDRNNNSLLNLMVLCIPCHRSLHRKN